MRRYLIHHDENRGTWDLVVSSDGQWSVEHSHGSQRHSFTIEEFQQTENGRRLVQNLTDAIGRARSGG